MRIDGDFLITYEYVNLQQNFLLCFCASIFHKTYMRSASQGTWETPFSSGGISISVLVDVER